MTDVREDELAVSDGGATLIACLVEKFGHKLPPLSS
jgi:hypothetical protein